LRNLVRALVLKKRIETTHARAKEASAFADKMVTIAKKGGLHARRELIVKLGNAEIAKLLQTVIAPKFKDRNGGYTRVLRTGVRVGDAAQTAILEWTAVFEAPAKKSKPKKEKKASEKAPEKPAAKETPKAAETKREAVEKPAAKKEEDKKGGFLGGLRKFFKGDEK
jgi:large subunit ribosomal protein L17